MTHSTDSADNISYAPDDNNDLSLGFKEIVFLAIIFFFGFSGFGICVDKIYAENPAVEDQIESVIIHEEDVSSISPSSISEGYAIQ